MLLDEVSKDRNNNLNIIRFAAAILVVFSHSYTLGNLDSDILTRLTKGQMTFGNLAVCIFFFFGGFFICRSAQKRQKAYLFFRDRGLRIFPGLWAVVLVSVFVLGVCVSQYDITKYFTSGQTYEYLLNGILIMRHPLPGVFEENIYGAVVNGSLWTLPLEFLCYIVCWLVYRAGLLREKRFAYTLPLFIIGYLACHWLFADSWRLQKMFRPCGMFYMGMLFYMLRKRIRINWYLVLLCCCGLILSSIFGVMEYGVLVFLPYVLVCIVFGTGRKFSGFGAKGEISYGMYLCAFPIQQTVIMLSGGSMQPVTNFFVSMPFILLGGILITVLVEKPVMRRWA